MAKVESTAGIPVFIAKTVDLSKDSIEALSESLSEKITEKLSSQIVDKFFEVMERLCIDENSGLLGLILKDHLDEILEKEQRKRQEEDSFKRAIRFGGGGGDLRPLNVYHDPIDVRGENERRRKELKKEQ
ncbi:MAG: hypothetical protein A2Y81_12455 [Nitrospirae bacterium RBG_13_43_8]|nr:MAG: hypothetical protein A2Y81_12455 [Nitrospirae bacterium RBG_13_43_8]